MSARRGRQPLPPPDLLVVGNVCVDRFAAAEAPTDRLGGPGAFATQLALRADARCALVTAAPRHFAPLAPLLAHPRLRAQVKDCPRANLFELHRRADGRRQQRVLTEAPALDLADVPAAWRDIPVCYVAPVLGEVGVPLVAALQARWLAVGAQGWLRRLDAHGWMVEHESEAFVRPPAGVRVMIFSVDDHPEAQAQARRLARRGILTVLTRGADGGELFVPGGRPQRYWPVAACERDATGAGDAFGCLFILALARGLSAAQAAEVAAAAAARVVEGPCMGTLEAVSWPAPPVLRAGLGG